jgi:two-component system, LytTR family, response regulator
MKAVVVEDHYAALQDLLYLIEDLCPELEIVGTAGDEPGAIRLIREKKPDLVFLDIELSGGGNGFTVLETLKMPQLQAIFVSGHGELAIHAFEADNVIHFLTKPVQENGLRTAVDRALDIQTLRQHDAEYRVLRDTTINKKRPRIALSDQQRFIFPYIDSIVHIEAEGTNTTFHFDKPASKMIVTKNIGAFAKLLGDYRDILMQVHRSHIVNLSKVTEYQRSVRLAVMEDGQRVPVAADKFEEFLQRLSQSNS